MLLSEALEMFRAEYIGLRGLARSTEENYALAVLSFTRAVGDKPVDAISALDILIWRRWMESKDTTSTIRGYMSKLKNVLLFTNKKNLSHFDVSDIHLPKPAPALPQYLYPEEVDRLISAARTVRDKCIISFLFSSGLRAGELCHLKRSDVDGVTVYVRKGKGNTSRPAFIDDRTRNLLNVYLVSRADSNEALFYSHKQRGLCTDSVNCLLKKIAARAGLEKKVHTHMLRHSFATNLVRNGVDISFVQRMMGHAFVSTTQIYVHLTSQDLQSAHQRVFQAKA